MASDATHTERQIKDLRYSLLCYLLIQLINVSMLAFGVNLVLFFSLKKSVW